MNRAYSPKRAYENNFKLSNSFTTLVVEYLHTLMRRQRENWYTTVVYGKRSDLNNVRRHLRQTTRRRRRQQ